MRQISISELQSDVVSWIRQAAIERQIVITDEGRPVATLISFFLSKFFRPLPNREERISRRPYITVDSAVYISEMRD